MDLTENTTFKQLPVSDEGIHFAYLAYGRICKQADT